MKSAPGKSNGFTLIEILIVVTIMSLLFGIGYAGYRQYARRQQLVTLARQLQGELRTAQELALSGSKPAGAECDVPDRLKGYNLTAASTQYVVYAICTGGNLTARPAIVLPTGFTIVRTYVSGGPSPEAFIIIKALGQGTNLTPSAAHADYTITDPAGATKVVTVTSGGEIK